MLELTISTLQDSVEALTNFDTELAQTVIAKERKSTKWNVLFVNVTYYV